MIIGKSISHYRILEMIGRGGMGVVYKAEDTRLERVVALKFLPDELASDTQAVERFRREARAASALNHPNICTIYEIGEEDGHTFIAMEYLQGASLQSHLSESHRAVPFEQLLDITIDVTTGLEVAHARGVIHRDIKPANIFVTEHGTAKILDFGLAKIATKATSANDVTMAGELVSSTGGALGTAAYMSPEQALGKPLDARTDLFSFGIVLYEMATGWRPFQGESTGILLMAIVQQTPTGPVRLNPNVPAELEHIISKALEKDPKLRYQHASEICADLKRMQRDSRQHSNIVVDEGAMDKIAPDKKTSKRSAATGSTAAPTAAERPAPKTWKFIVPAVGILIVATLAGLNWRSHRPIKLSDKDTIVLADFVNTTGDPIFDGSLKQGLSAELGQSPFLNVLPDKSVIGTLKQMNRPPDTRLSQQVADEVCLRTNSKVFVAGSIERRGDHYLVGVKAVNCEGENIVASSEVEAENRDGVLTALSEAGKQVRRKLGESLASVEKFNKLAPELTTSSLEALRVYSQGYTTSNTQGSAEAIPYYKRAVELDPNFASAWLSLGVAYANLGQSGTAIPYLQKAFDLRFRLSTSERLFVEALYYQNVTGEIEKANDVYLAQAKLTPGARKGAGPRNNLAFNFMRLGQYEKAAEMTGEALQLSPNSNIIHSNLVGIYRCLDRPDEAIHFYDEAQTRGLEIGLMHVHRYVLAFLQDDRAGMEEQVTASAGKKGMEDEVLEAESDTEAYHGRMTEARHYSQQAMDSATRNNASESAATYKALESVREAEVGRVAIARKDAEEALALSSGRDVEEMAAYALARSGETAQAQQLADKLNQESPLNTLVQGYWQPTIRAAIAMNRNEPGKAIEALQVAAPYELGFAALGNLYPVYIRGLACLQAGKGQEAAVEFQKILNHRGIVGNFVLGALAHLQLGRAEIKIGDRIAARKEYEDFFALWKDADLDIPILKEAKAEYAKLQ